MKDAILEFVKLQFWSKGRKAGMGSNLFFVAILLYVAGLWMVIHGYAVPENQKVTFEGFLTLIGIATTLVAGGTIMDKRHDRLMKELDKTPDPAPVKPDAPPSPAA